MKETFMRMLIVLSAFFCPCGWAVEFEREVVIEIRYGDGLDEVGIGTPRIGTEDVNNEGPDRFVVTGDSLIYISDLVNRKVKCFRLGEGLVWASEGDVECTGSMAVGSDGSVYVRPGGSRRNVTVFDRHGKLKAKTPMMAFTATGVMPEWTPARVDSVVYEAELVGLYHRGPRLKDGLGNVYRCERRNGEPLRAKFSTDAEGLEFEMSVDLDGLPDTLKGVDSIDYWSMDGFGRLYAVCSSEKQEPTVILEWEDRESLISDADLTVLVYDRAGALLGSVRQDYPPPFMASAYDVAKVMPNGNIYCYNYTAEGLQVVRYRPIEE